MKHHPFSPSRLQRRALCPASYRIEKDLEDVDSEAALKGTHLHELIAKAINLIPSTYWADKLKYNSWYWPEDEEFAEIIDEAKIYSTRKERSVILKIIRYISSKMRDVLFFIDENFKYGFQTEGKLEYKDNNGNVLYSGTVSMQAVDGDGRLYLFVWETGTRDLIPARMNLKLKAYALAAMQTHQLDVCRCFIYNPITNRRSNCTFQNKEKLEREILGIINKCKTEDAPTVPGEIQCHFCLGSVHKVCPNGIRYDVPCEKEEKQQETPKVKIERHGEVKKQFAVKTSNYNIQSFYNVQIKEDAKRYEEPIKKELPATKQRRIVKVKNYDLLPKKEVSDAEGCMFGFMWGCMPIIIFIFLVWLLKALS